MRSRILQCLVFAPLLAVPLATADVPLPTQAFRQEHAEIKEHLRHLHEMAGTMATADAAEQKKAAGTIASFLGEHIVPHAKWEEQHLYPAVDKRTHAGKYPFTASMRYEHTIVGREIAELNAMAAKPTVDAKAFARKTDALLGLINAHFEEEEQVLLPILDKTSTKKGLEKELGMEKH